MLHQYLFSAVQPSGLQSHVLYANLPSPRLLRKHKGIFHMTPPSLSEDIVLDDLSSFQLISIHDGITWFCLRWFNVCIKDARNNVPVSDT